jgi:DNA-binding response OmpR family regulator
MNDLQASVRVLVAEDDADMRALVAATLRADGYDVDEALDGSDALMSITASRIPGHEDYDLVLSDVRMPVMTGVELATRLKRMGYTTPLLLMSAFADEALHAQAEKLGLGMLVKPFDLDELRVAVTNVLDHAGK